MRERTTQALTAEQVEFLREGHYATTTTLRADGSPHSTVTWVDSDGEHVVLNVTDTRVKTRHLERDPRIAVMVVDRSNPYRWLSVSGTAEITADGAEEHINELSHRYFGRDYSYRPGERRLIVRVTPERVTAYRVGAG